MNRPIGGERTVVEVLEAARKRITPIERWTQKVHARSKQRGAEVEPQGGSATCWCAIGALYAEGIADPYTDGREALHFLEKAAGEWPPMVNDRGLRAESHPRVLEMYDRAIELAQQHNNV